MDEEPNVYTEARRSIDAAKIDEMQKYNCYWRRNFTATGELTVRITLEEYRFLVSTVAGADARINKAENDLRNALLQVGVLKEQLDALKEQGDAE